MEKEKKRKNGLNSDSCDSSYTEKRRGIDRRTNNKSRLKYLLFNGRRVGSRRRDDSGKAVIFDRYDQNLFLAITTILALSILDALLTLVVIQRGATELNPVMAYFLEHGTPTFIVAKYVLTSIGVLILLIFKNVFLTKIKIRTLSLFPCVIVVFLTVIAWELFLIFCAS
jgi:hypothetical protein